MKKAIITSLSIMIFSCHSQQKDKLNSNQPEYNIKQIQLEIPINPKTMEAYTNEEFTKEDIEKYKKNKNDGSYEYVRPDEARVLETDDEFILFSRDITPKNSLFTLYKEYHPNRRLWMKYERYKNGGFTKGIFYTYNEDGKLIKAEDWDKPFKFTWDQVKKYCEEELKLDLFNDKVGIANDLEYPGYNFPTWSINYHGKYKNRNGLIRIMLDGTTGNLLYVECQLGKGGEGTTFDVLYDAKAEKKKKDDEDNAYYKTYKGKKYTKKEWEIFEEEWYQNHLKQKNSKGFWDDIFKRQ